MTVQEAIEALRRLPATAEVIALVVADTDADGKQQQHDGYEYTPTFH